ncbi:hypothetical protein ACFU6E_26090 [Bacillus cereus]|uniref:hypothetical protein n=1 Tax=Bacillus cereus TaxID=1396 RepID=UPI00366B73DF
MVEITVELILSSGVSVISTSDIPLIAGILLAWDQIKRAAFGALLTKVNGAKLTSDRI